MRASFRPARPFLKWAGGKGQLLPRLRKYIPIPDENQTYFEPFLGAGAVFFALRPQKAVLSDINRPLIETYGVVKNRAKDLLKVLGELSDKPDSDEYYARRRDFNELVQAIALLGPHERTRLAALFIWLNHTCYNGLFRVNRSGLFNVPFSGSPDPSIYDAANILAVSSALRRGQVVIRSADYRESLRDAKRDDIAYLDPPYDSPGRAVGFTEYTAAGFDRVDQAELARTVKGLVRRGCRVVLSNSSTPIVRELYQKYEVHTIQARRAISCQGDRRGNVKETLVIA